MNSKETIMAAISNAEIDYVPVAPPFQGYWALRNSNIQIADSIKKPYCSAQAQIDAVERCGFDAFEASWDWLSMVEILGCSVKIPPKGEIVTRNRVIIGPESLDRLNVPDPKDDYRAMSSAKTAELLVHELGREKFLYSTICCPFTLIGELRGVEALLLDLVMQPDFANEMLKFGTEVSIEYCKFLIGTGVDGVLMCDPTASGSLVNKNEFCDYSRTHIMDCFKEIRTQGAHPMLHICGDTTSLLDCIVDMGEDIFSLDHTVNLAKAAKMMKGHGAVLGNMSPMSTLFKGAQIDIINKSRECIDQAGKVGFILGAGCDFIVDTPEINIATMKNVSLCISDR
jgi:MtaA/CmuA family methyltransferase